MGILSKIGSWFSAPANTKPAPSPVAPEDRMRGRSTADAGAIVAGLTPAKMLSLLRNATTGQIADQADLFFAMEEGDPDIASSLAIRRMGVLSCGQGQVLPPDEGESDADAQRSVDLCEQAISTLDRSSKVANPAEGIRLRRGWRGALRHHLDAIGSAIAIVEPQWETSEKQWWWGGVECRPLKWFQLGYPGGAGILPAISPDELRLRDGTAQGARVNPMNFWIHQVDAKSGAPAATSLLRQLARLYVIRNYAWKDLLQFGELFGVPLRVGSWRDGATEEEKQALYAMLLGLSTNAVAVKHKDDTIEFPTVGGATSGGQGSSIFERMLSMTKDSITLLVQGQLATSGTGSGFSNQSAQQNVRWDLLDDDAYSLEETIRWQAFAPLIWFNLGPNAPVPKYQFPREEPKDSKATVEMFSTAAGLGVRIGRAWAQEKLGIPEPDDDEEILEAPKPPPSPFGVGQASSLPSNPEAGKMPAPPPDAAAEDMMAANAIIANFDPGQPRDEHGMWTAGASTTVVERKLSSGATLAISVVSHVSGEGRIRVTRDGVSITENATVNSTDQAHDSPVGKVYDFIRTPSGSIPLTRAEAIQIQEAKQLHTRPTEPRSTRVTPDEARSTWQGRMDEARARFNRTFERGDSSQAFARQAKDEAEANAELRRALQASNSAGVAEDIIAAAAAGQKKKRPCCASEPLERFVR